jgi:rhomboid protease GluP
MVRRPSTGGALRLAKRFPTTVALAAAMVGMYGLQLALGGGEEAAVRLGALRADRVMEHHELYRLVAASWLHHGPVHLAINVAAFAQLGSLVEYVWGGLRMAVIFLATSLVAAVAACAFGPYGLPTYGASGGVLGLAGLAIAARWVGDPSLRLWLQEAVGRRLTVGVAFTFVAGLLLEVGLPDVVSGWGHVGGFVAGLVLAFSVREPSSGRELFRLLGAVSVAGLLATTMGVAWHGPVALGTHHQDMARVLLTRASARPDTYGAYLDLVPMLDHYTEAGQSAEGNARFAEQVGAMQELRLVRGLVGRLYYDAEVNEHDRPEALQIALERWLELRPHDPEVLNAVAWHLVTRPDVSRRDPARAVGLAEKALRRVPPERPKAWYARGLDVLTGVDPSGPRPMRASTLDTLAEALLQEGRVEEALEAQRESVQIATELELSELDAMRTRLERIEEAG